MEDTSRIQPSVCFAVEKVIGVSIGNGNVKNYQVQWGPTWVSGFHLVGCEHLIEEFLRQRSEKGQQVDDATTTSVICTDDLRNDSREDVLGCVNVPQLNPRQQFTEDFHNQLSTVVNEHCFDKQETNSCLYSNTSNDNANVKVEINMETNVPNKKICARDTDMGGNNPGNTDFELAKTEDMSDSNDMIEENAMRINPAYNISHPDNDDTIDNAAGSLKIDCGTSEFQNNFLEIKREVIEEEPETVQGSSNPDVGHNNNSNGNTPLHTTEIFVNKSNANRHGRLCTGQKSYNTSEKHFNMVEKPYRCPECDKQFLTNGDRKRHLLLHTGEKPYTCTVCNKAFARKDTLSRHFRLHTGEKPYKCVECNKSFSDNGNLRYHLLRCHRGEKT